MKNLKKKNKVVVVSGGFDPVHVGHIDMFRRAKELGDKLVIILNSDRFLRIKKGYVFMPYKERKKILKNLSSVDRVIHCIDTDQTVCKTLKALKPDIFANGGDRTKKNIPEIEICKKYGIEMIFGVGGKKKQSSSWLLRRYEITNYRKR